MVAGSRPIHVHSKLLKTTIQNFRLRGQKGENPLWALPLEVKIEEVTLSLARKRPSNPEPVAAIPTRSIVKVAVREASAPPNPYHASRPAPSGTD